MTKLKLKFALAGDFLLITIVFIVFFSDHLFIFTNWIFPVIFVYFLINSLYVLFPVLHSYIPSKKHVMSTNIQYDEAKLSKLKSSNNKRALVSFILYFGALTVIGIIYLSYDFFEEIHIYLLFLVLNLLDYFCILVWCPFKNLILKNSCCYTCRITNWDRLMKFYILIFIPNIYTITLVILGILTFLVWEYQHQVHPERFYSISNEVLRCSSCNVNLCKKKKE